MNPELHFNYFDEGQGPALLFQHGLGGNMQQISDLLLPGIPDRRLLCLECLNHGTSAVTTEAARLSLPAFAEDLEAFADSFDMSGGVVGGLSMGAALAMRLMIQRPKGFAGLILLRPAWLDAPAPDNLRVLLDIAEYLEAYGPWEGKELFRRTDSFRQMLAAVPGAAHGVLAQFETPHPQEKAHLLRGIVRSAPVDSLDALAAIRVPTLVLASEADPIHPLSLALELTNHIPGAVFREIPSRFIDESAHNAAVRTEIAAFLQTLTN